MDNSPSRIFALFHVTESSTAQHEDFVTNRNTRLSEIMTPVKNLVTVKEGIDLLKANNILQTSKKVGEKEGTRSEGLIF